LDCSLKKKLRESWAVGVEWWLTKLEYKNTRGIANYGDWNDNTLVQYPNYQGFQNWNKQLYPDYTNVYINLIDDYNEKPFFGPVDDDVKGYSLFWIEDLMLKHIYNLDDLKQQLKDRPKPLNVTDADIDKLISFYE
jgi:hypothetical protein